MNDEISLALVCPHCGKDLVDRLDRSALKVSDILRCPVHGDIGRLDEMAYKFGEKAAQNLTRELADTFQKKGDNYTKH